MSSAASDNPPPSFPVAALYAMALASGVAALAYELTWSRMLALTFGGTTVAAAAVIGGFMGGMGLGAWAYRFVAPRVRRPLVVYGSLEFLIAVSAALVSRVFYRLPHWFAGVAEQLPDGPALALLRFVVAFGLLLAPAALMGATFPALCLVLIRDAREFDRHLGRLYGINTLGAALGALLAGLWWIEAVGLMGTVAIANGLNLAIAVPAWLLGERRAATAETASQEKTIPSALPNAVTALALVVCGGCTLGYEILWFRGLRYLVGNSTFALTVVLVLFLVGLALGSLALGWLTRLGRPELRLAQSQWIVAALAMLTIGALEMCLSQPAIREQVGVFGADMPSRAWWLRLMIGGGCAALLMLPAAIVMGCAFPLATRLFLGSVDRLGARVGLAYLLANLGSIAGSLLAAVWLLPALGTIGGTKALAVVNLLLGALIWLPLARREPRSWPLGAFCALLVGGLVWQLPRQLTLHGESSAYDRSRILFSEEGDLATVQVLDDPVVADARAVTIDGCVIGATPKFVSYIAQKQSLLALLPLAVDGRIATTLHIGLGSGGTLDAMAGYRQITVLDCVEINAGVAEASRRYFHEGARLADPRVRLSIEDALYFLLREPRQYDAIISDGKQNPDFPGNATMLCHDFYRYARARLAPEGLFVQWTPLGMVHREFLAVLRNFCDVFPHVGVFYFPDTEVLMVGSQSPLAGRNGIAVDEWHTAPASRAIAAFGYDTPASLVARLHADREQLLAALPPGPLSTWDHNWIEFVDYKATPQERSTAYIPNLELLAEAAEQPPAEQSLWAAIPDETRRMSGLIRQSLLSVSHADYAEAVRLAEQAVEVGVEDRSAQEHLRTLRELHRRLTPPTGQSPRQP